MSEVIKGDINIAFNDVVEIGRAEHPDTHGDMVYLAIKTASEGALLAYFGTPKSLDDTIEALMRARRDAFGTKP